MNARTSLAWLVAIAAGAAVPSPALADAAARVRAPDGWQRDADRAARLEAFLRRDDHFGGLGAGAQLDGSEVAVWSAPEGGAALIVSVVRAPAPPALAVAVRAELDAIRAATRAAALDGSGVDEIAWRERADDAARAIEATLEWRHRGNQSLSISRTLIAARADGIERATAECVLREDLAATVGPRCRAALASLEPSIPQAHRVAMALPSAAPAAPPAAASKVEPPRLTDGSAIALPPMQIAPPERDRGLWGYDPRGYYFVGGLLVLAAIFLWNRNRRRDDGTESGAKGGER